MTNYAILKTRLDVNKRYLYALVMLIAVIWGIAIAVTVASTARPLEQNSLAHGYTGLMSRVLPLERYGRLSSFPDQTKLYHAVIWWTFIPFFLLSLVWIKTSWKGAFAKPRAALTLKEWLALFVSIVFFGFFGFAAYYANQGQDTRLTPFGTSFSSLLFLGIIWPAISAVFFAIAIIALLKIVSR